MIAWLKLKPGQRGTKKLVAEHGEALVCVAMAMIQSPNDGFLLTRPSSRDITEV